MLNFKSGYLRVWIANLNLLLGLLLFSDGTAESETIKPGAVWLDHQSNEIQAHGGGILKLENTYYWFGEDRTPGLERDKRYVSCYSSTDLIHWNFCNRVVKLSDPEELGGS